MLHTENSNVPCPVCNIVLFDRSNVRRHMATIHSNHVDKDARRQVFPCSLCPSVLSRSDSLRRHVRMHHQDQKSVRSQPPRREPAPTLTAPIIPVESPVTASIMTAAAAAPTPATDSASSPDMRDNGIYNEVLCTDMNELDLPLKKRKNSPRSSPAPLMSEAPTKKVMDPRPQHASLQLLNNIVFPQCNNPSKSKETSISTVTAKWTRPSVICSPHHSGSHPTQVHKPHEANHKFTGGGNSIVDDTEESQDVDIHDDSDTDVFRNSINCVNSDIDWSSDESVEEPSFSVGIPSNIAPQELIEKETAFRGFLKTYKLRNSEMAAELTIQQFLVGMFEILIPLFQKILEHVNGIKTNLWLDCEFSNVHGEKCLRNFKTCNTIVLRSTDLEDLCSELFQKLVNEKESCEMKGSGWTFMRIVNFEIRVNVYNPLRA